MTTESLLLIGTLFVGVMAGVLFFGGLWLTVQRLPSAKHPGLLMAGSSALRMAIVLALFFIVGRAHLDRMLICLAGFLLARFLVTRQTSKR